MSNDEQGKFDDLEKKIAGIDATIKAKEKVRSMYPGKKQSSRNKKRGNSVSKKERSLIISEATQQKSARKT